MTVDGKTVNAIEPEEASHTFVVPELGRVRAAARASPKKPRTSANSRPAKGRRTARSPSASAPASKGRYRWQCFVPCAAGFLDGFGGPMQTLGYMDGFIDVV